MNNFIDFGSLEKGRSSAPVIRPTEVTLEEQDFPSLSTWSGGKGFRVSATTGEIIIKRGKEKQRSKPSQKQTSTRKNINKKKLAFWIRNVILKSIVDEIILPKDQKAKIVAQQNQKKRQNMHHPLRKWMQFIREHHSQFESQQSVHIPQMRNTDVDALLGQLMSKLVVFQDRAIQHKKTNAKNCAYFEAFLNSALHAQFFFKFQIPGTF